MELEHSFIIPVPPEQAWPVLLDVERIAPCMPGATIDAVDGDVIKGRIKVKVGPVAMTYAGTAHFTERDEQARSITLEASGKETRGAGTASATVRSSLEDEGGQTKVVVHTSMNVTGRPAQFGRGVMAEVGGRIIERFATNLAALLASAPAATVAASNGSGPGADASGPGAGSADGAPGPATIEELNLPVRAYNSLRRVGIHTVDDLSARTEADLLAIENLGPQSVREIKERLAGIGRHLADQAAGAPASAAATAGGADGASARGADAASARGADGASAGVADAASAGGADGASADSAAVNGVGAGATAPRAARPPDEDAIDLLSVAGFPVLKRVLPVLAAVAVLLLVIFGLRRGRRGD
jgi:carbon monoxide dehydrogenase subunit G